MPYYRCSLVDTKGRLSESIQEAPSMDEAARSFSRGNSYLVFIDEYFPGVSKSSRKYSDATVRDFTAMTSLLLSSGLALKEALMIEAQIVKGKSSITNLLSSLNASIEKGYSFSKALESMGNSFSDFYRGMIKIGERAGAIEQVFPRIASYMGERKRIKEKMISALMYPSLVFLLAIIGSMFIMLFIVPQLVDVFNQIGTGAAKEVQSKVFFMRAFFGVAGLFLILMIISIVTIIVMRNKSVVFARIVDRELLRVPIAGPMLIAYSTLNFAYAMETLVGGGVPIENGLKDVASVIGNLAYRDAILTCRSEVLKGNSLSFAIQKSSILPDHIARWIAIGERTGKTEEVFRQLRTYYQEEVDRMTSRFMILVEPLMILGVGVLVLVLIVIFVLPLFTMYGAIL